MNLIKLGLYFNCILLMTQVLLMLIEWKRFKYQGCWYVTLILLSLSFIVNFIGYSQTIDTNFIAYFAFYVLSDMLIWCVLLAKLISSIEYPTIEEFESFDEDDFDDDIIEDAINEEGI